MTEETQGVLEALGLPRVYQLGIVVKRIEEAVRFYTSFMGISPWYRGEVKEMTTEYRGNEIAMEADMVFGYSGKLMIELIEPLEGPSNIYSDFLEEQGEGLHHLGVEVSGFDKYMRRVEDMGIPVMQSGTLVSKGGAVSKMAYLDTRSWCGYPIEIMETRLFGMPCGKGQFMMNVGCLLGDASKVKV
jgi:methylmalonyl-CoA/ethylmalonyl-CoA epimerase